LHPDIFATKPFKAMRADAVATKPFKAMRAALDPLVQVDNANTKATPAICEHCSMCRTSRSEKIEQSSQGFNVYLRNKQGGFDVNTSFYCSGSDNAVDLFEAVSPNSV
jgi:hypothetical protein